jgi:large subunit ribosomal protein L29
MKAAKFRDMSIEELQEQAEQLRKDLFFLRVANTTKELQNTAQIPQVRRDLARVLGIIGEKERAA